HGRVPRRAAPALLLRPLPVPVPRRRRAPRRRAALVDGGCRAGLRAKSRAAEARSTMNPNRMCSVLLALASLGFVAALELSPIRGADFWTHLRVGDEIRETGRIPEHFEVTYTEAKDERFVAYEWLGALLWSYLYRI